MKEKEIKEAEEAGIKLVDAILGLKKLSKKQIQYLELNSTLFLIRIN